MLSPADPQVIISQLQHQGFRPSNFALFTISGASMQTGWEYFEQNPIVSGVVADASFLHISPRFVFRPHNCEQLRRIIVIADQNALAVTVAAGKTGLSGGYANPDVLIDLDGLKIQEQPILYHLDEINPTISVDQSVLVADLIRDVPNATQHRYMFPIQPSSAFKLPVRVGGLIGTDASGVTSGKLGSIKAWIEKITVMLPSGEIRQLGITDSLFSSMIGQNGRFGIVLTATIRLYEISTFLHTCILFGGDIASLQKGLHSIQEQQIFPLVSEFILSEVGIGGKFASYFSEKLSFPVTWVILLKDTQDQLDSFRDILQKHTLTYYIPVPVADFKLLLEERTSLALQAVDRNSEQILLSFPGFEDILIPPLKLKTILDTIGGILESFGYSRVRVGYGHLNFRQGQGILLHVRLPIPVEQFWDPIALERICDVIARVNFYLKEQNITPKAEHTPGILYPWLTPEKVPIVEDAIASHTAFRCPALGLRDHLMKTIPNYNSLNFEHQFALALRILLRGFTHNTFKSSD
jgi:FAD/FMN-containing dehydrogenase